MSTTTDSYAAVRCAYHQDRERQAGDKYEGTGQDGELKKRVFLDFQISWFN